MLEDDVIVMTTTSTHRWVPITDEVAAEIRDGWDESIDPFGGGASEGSERAHRATVKSDLHYAARPLRSAFEDTRTYAGIAEEELDESSGVNLTLASADANGYCV